MRLEGIFLQYYQAIRAFRAGDENQRYLRDLRTRLVAQCAHIAFAANSTEKWRLISQFCELWRRVNVLTESEKEVHGQVFMELGVVEALLGLFNEHAEIATLGPNIYAYWSDKHIQRILQKFSDSRMWRWRVDELSEKSGLTKKQFDRALAKLLRLRLVSTYNMQILGEKPLMVEITQNYRILREHITKVLINSRFRD